MADVIRNTGPAVVVASAAAGPIAIATIGLGFLLSGEPLSVGLDSDIAAGLITGGLYFFVFATIVALIPNFIGVRVMGLLTSRNVGLRHPAIWAMAGAVSSGVPAWLLLGCDPGHSFVAGWAAIGALSAIVCRSRVRWDIPAPA